MFDRVACRALKSFHFRLAANHKRRALVNVPRLNVHNPPYSIYGCAAGWLGYKCEWVGFIQQPQLALRIALRGRVQKNTTFENGAVEIRH
jgi:hypothetical protein